VQDIEWDAVTLAGMFVLGSILGAVATLRLARAVLATFERPHRTRDAKEPPPSEDDGGS